MNKTTFADFDLPEKILDVLADLNLFEPTPIQEKSLKPILSGRDVMGIAQTGTEKLWLICFLFSKLGNITKLEIQRFWFSFLQENWWFR
jgi:superfamily II DNA/RNA helicase